MTNDYYQKNKEKLWKEARERYQNLSEEEKDKKRQYALERYRNLSEAEKGKKRQYGREWYKSLLQDEYRTNFSRMQEIKTGWGQIIFIMWSMEYKKIV